MNEEIIIKSITKEEKYVELLPQIKSLLQDESDLIANLANVCAALKQTFDFFWIGFYLVKHEQLVLGPFQGPVACTRINKGKGVCGTSWMKAETILVPDVEQFPGHIACNAKSKSEIVLPLLDAKKHVIGVLDLDSDVLNSFDQIDEHYLKQIISLIKF